MEEKIIYFVRHGESVDNAAPVFQSEDSPLSEKGIKQAENIAARASNLDFELIISSPLTRTKQTAEIVAKTTGKKIEFSDIFVERIKPEYIGGKPYTDEKANKMWREWEKSLYTPGMRIEDSENFDDILIRDDKSLDFLINRKEKVLFVVTHGYFLRTIIFRILLGNLLSPQIFRNMQKMSGMENTGLTILRYRSGFEEDAAWRLWVYNDHAHLG